MDLFYFLISNGEFDRMIKSCSNCKYATSGYCIVFKIAVRDDFCCATWKRLSTTKQFYDKKKRQKVRRKSIRQEKQIAKETGGRRQPMSGAGYHKGDVKTKLHLIEIKFTDKKSYALNRDTMKKIFYEATYEDRIPYLQIRMGKDNYCVLRKEDFDAL